MRRVLLTSTSVIGSSMIVSNLFSSFDQTSQLEGNRRNKPSLWSDHSIIWQRLQQQQYNYLPIAGMESASSPPPSSALITEESKVAIISGTTNPKLSQHISGLLHLPLSDAEITLFSDGEINISINESLRGKDVFVIQTCSPPINDAVMELLLTVGAAKRAGASTVTAVVPYFGYRLSRRGLPISPTHSSRFLWNAAGDVAKMLTIVGVDKIVSVDLQRPGQGHEACFFTTHLPAETIHTSDMFVDYFREELKESDVPIVIVAPNMELSKKARKFQRQLRGLEPQLNVDIAAFLRNDADTSFARGAVLELQGDVKGADVILIEDYIDSMAHISALCNRLAREGARRVFVCATHAYLDESSMQLIDLSPLVAVVITDTISLLPSPSSKIVQLSVAPYLAKVIQSDLTYDSTGEFTPDEEDDSIILE